MSNRQILFLSHGGGPMPLLDDEAHIEMVECLTFIARKMNRPSAILVISAHWEESVASITAANSPALMYDYYGFPEESYRIEYPCIGMPELAEKIHKQFSHDGFKAILDQERGFDHGVFIPLKIMFPDADIPCVQLSLMSNLDPEIHIKMGESLKRLDGDNLLIIGSGFSFHNMREFFAPQSHDSQMKNSSFESWLKETCCSQCVDEKERRQRLVNWTKAPFARFCHPREEHLLPLHVCYGAAQTACKESFQLSILNKESSMYLWY